MTDMLRALHYSHQLLDSLIHRFPDGNFIDATLGKGKDSALILQHPAFRGKVYSFDIQDQAIQESRQRLASLEQYDRIEIIQDSHANLSTYLGDQAIHGAIFNLGYLPGGDHTITTQADSTLAALDQIRSRLVIGGQILIVVYAGHPQGQIEKSALFTHLATWPQTAFQVLQYGFINQINHPPLLLVVEKTKEESKEHSTLTE